MGTNYYVAPPDDGVDHDPEWGHIGKQSVGWAWCWADLPVPAPPIADQWAAYAKAHPEARVIDEYGRDRGLLVEFVNEPERVRSDYHHSGWFS